MVDVAITGAGGYVGRRLLQCLDGAVGYDLPSIAAEYDDVQAADCRDEGAMSAVASNVDAVIHLAALAGVADCGNAPTRALRSNIEALSTVARYCQANGTRLVHPSSQAIYGDSLYGASKAIGEDLIDAMPGLSAVVIEFSNIYGRYPDAGEYRQKSTVIEAFIECVSDGQPPVVHAPGTQRRNFIHIDDVTKAYAAALECPTGRYTVAGPDTYSIRDLAERIAAITDRDIDIEIQDVDRPGVETDIPDVETTLPGVTPEKTVNEYARKRIRGVVAG